MDRRVPQLVGLLLAAMLIVQPRWSAAQAPADRGPNRITWPRAGDAIYGVVAIEGTAWLPDLQFYKVEMAPVLSPNAWSVIGELQRVPVEQGRLVSWDTRLVPDGDYLLRLHVVRSDGNYDAHEVPDIRVANVRPTPTGTPTLAPSPTSVPPTAPAAEPTLMPATPIPSPMPTATSGPGTWSPATLLSTNTTLSWFPAILGDEEGRVHVVYASGRASAADAAGEDLVMYTAQLGGDWSEPRDIISPGRGGYPTRPRIALDGSGWLNLSFRAGVSIYHARADTDAASSPQAWQQSQRVSGHGAAYYSDIAIDSHGRIHMIWNESTPDVPGEESWVCPDCMDILYRYSDDGGRTWSAPTNLSSSPGGSNRPFLVADGQDVLHVVWEEAQDYTGQGQPLGVGYRRSLDRGVTWEQAYRAINSTSGPPNTEATPTPLPPPVFRAWFEPTLSLDGAGMPIMPALAANIAGDTLLLVWRTTADEYIYYQTSKDVGATWSPPNTIPGLRTLPWAGSSPFDALALVSDGSGRAHLMLVGQLDVDSSSQVGLYHVVWDGRAWASPEVVFEEEDSYPEWPQVFVSSSGQALHAVWFVRGERDRFRSEEGTYTVRYSSRPLDALPQPLRAGAPASDGWALPTPQPTDVSLGSATASAWSAPESRSEPGSAGGDAVDMALLQSDRYDVRALLASLVPAVGVCLLYIWWRRRHL